MPRLLLAAMATAAAVAAAAAPASAITITCEPHKYLLIDEGGDQAVSNLRAHNLQRKTSGYAPRCLVAEAIASRIQFAAHEGRRPRRVQVVGAQWSSGKWRCSYPAGKARCHKVGKPKRRITMNLG